MEDKGFDNVTKKFFYIFLLVLALISNSLHVSWALSPFLSWLFSANNLSTSPTNRRKERLNARDSLPFLSPSKNYSLSRLFSHPHLWWHQKWCPICSPLLTHIPAYLSRTLWSLLASCSIDHSLYPTLPHLLLFTTSHFTLKWYGRPSGLLGTPRSLIPLCLWTHSSASWKPSSYLPCTFLLLFT